MVIISWIVANMGLFVKILIPICYVLTALVSSTFGIGTAICASLVFVVLSLIYGIIVNAELKLGTWASILFSLILIVLYFIYLNALVPVWLVVVSIIVSVLVGVYAIARFDDVIDCVLSVLSSNVDMISSGLFYGVERCCYCLTNLLLAGTVGKLIELFASQL